MRKNHYDANGILYKKIKIYKYQITKNYNIEVELPCEDFDLKYFSYVEGFLSIKRGYRSDGPSGITLDTKDFMRGAFIHDVLYDMHRRGLLDIKYRKLSDKLLYIACREDGMGWMRANYIYRALRIGGRSSAIAGPLDEI